MTTWTSDELTKVGAADELEKRRSGATARCETP